jgi:hypothetical protein
MIRTTLRHGRLVSGVSLTFLLLLLSLSCASLTGDKSDTKHLTFAIERFNTSMQWQDYKTAALLLDPSLQTSFWSWVDQMQGRIRITSCEIRSLNLANDHCSGDVLLHYSYYYTNDPYIRSHTLHQHWQYTEKDKRWKLVQDDLNSIMPPRP